MSDGKLRSNNMKVLIVFAVVLVAANAVPKDYVSEFEQPKGEGKHWALLVAGSNGWMNYRHQADVCHAYQVIKGHGIPDENIIVMMYDDIAENRENPEKGTIINQPDGPNVYDGVPKDYTGMEVTPDNFLAVLTGDAEAVNGKRVINSNAGDHIFVNFVDHGAPGLIAFPEATLSAKDLNQAIKKMYDDQKYAKMVFYIEACESGSMFENLLPKDINVFATTASNPHESSYACYFDKERKTYLGDVYSVKWMQDSDKENLNSETLQKQFSIIKDETKTSHVQEYGDLSMASLTVAEFQGNQVMSARTSPKPKDPCADAVKSEDVPLEVYTRLSKDQSLSMEERKMYSERLEAVKQDRDLVERTFKEIVNKIASHHVTFTELMTGHSTIQRWDCYYDVLEHLENNCDKLNLPKNDYALRHLKVIVNMCEAGYSAEEMKSVIDKTC